VKKIQQMLKVLETQVKGLLRVVELFESRRPKGQAIVSELEGEVAAIDTRGLLSEKVLKGCTYGSIRPRVDIPRFIDLYMAGRLKLDELVTRSYPLEGINEAFAAMKAGEVARSIVTFFTRSGQEIASQHPRHSCWRQPQGYDILLLDWKGRPRRALAG
jgi:Zn-dependent alcohol dehydrogenase